ncbi:MAG TPA: Ig-like domain-containing protein [Thermomicrobiaceae bacterium]|nr:Ig-like domain-containing protein [Thermomicrobiaceae bacterium]
MVRRHWRPLVARLAARCSALLLIVLLALGAWSAPASAAGSNLLTLSPSSQHALVNGSVQVTATLQTGTGTLVSGALIQLSISGTVHDTLFETTNDQGQATFRYTSDSAGMDTLVAATASAQFSATATVTWQIAGQPSAITLTPATLTAPVGSAPAFTATVVDSSGAPVPNVAVSFMVSGVNSAGATRFTDGNGHAAFAYTGTQLGQDTLTAAVAGGITPARATITWSNALRIAINPDTLTAATGTAQTLVATVVDATGSPISLATVSFTVTGANSASGSQVTDGKGQASFTYTGRNAGSDSVTATTPAAPAAATATIDWITNAAISLSPSNAAAAVGSAQVVTATVVDLDGDPVAGLRVSFNVSGANAASGAVTTDSDGRARFSYTGTHVGSDTLNATAPGVGRPATATILWSVAESVGISPETVTVAAGAPQAFSATVVDIHGDPMAGVVVTFTVAGANSAGGAVATDSNGVATFSYSGSASGSDSVTAFVDLNGNGRADSGEPSTKAAVTRASATLTLAASGARAVTGTAIQITATLSTGGGSLAGKTVVFTVSGANPDNASATTTDGGQARFSYSGAIAGTDTITAYADLNGNGSQDTGEPAATISVSWSAPTAPSLPAAERAAPKAGCTYFAVTGHNLCGGFAAYWSTFGGLAVYGYPLTEEFQQNGFTVQYFERARFEWHPGEWPARYDVELGLLGNSVTAGRSSEAPFQPAAAKRDAGCSYFAATQHNLCGDFGAYWQQNGGLAVFGFPLSEEFQEKNPDTGEVYTVQYFERARFEWHPAQGTQPGYVELGRLGAQLLDATYGTNF